MKFKTFAISRFLSAASFLALCAPIAQAGTTTTTFSFQQGDLAKDGAPYGSASAYAGVVDGSVTDDTATTGLTGATIGNLFRSGTNGQNFVSLFSYNLTELNDYIAANTSPTSTVAVTSVSFRLVSTGGVATNTGTLNLYRTEPFTAAANWSTTEGVTPWSTPYQSPSSETAYKYTGGGSALTATLGGTTPQINGTTIASGSPILWTSSSTFIGELNGALGRADKTLYLMAARPLANVDSRVTYNRGTSANVDNRPELLVELSVTTGAPPATWTGASGTSWIVAGNWSPAVVPGTGAPITFNASSTANLATVLNQNFDVLGVTVTAPAGPVSIGGVNSLTIGTGGLDLSAATRDLTISAPMVLSALQSWSVASGRTLALNGGVTGGTPLTLTGAGTVALGAPLAQNADTAVAAGTTLRTDAANVLPNGAATGSLVLDGKLRLNGNSQSLNGLNGSGSVDNLAAAVVTLTVGGNDAAGAFGGTIQNTGGALALVKTGSGPLVLTGANSYSGGTTVSGSGNLFPNNNSALGTGPVVASAGRIYATGGSYTFENALTLSGDAFLEVGGANNRTLTWNGPVTLAGNARISADNGTAGVTLAGNVSNPGFTLTSFATGTANTISGNISGAGGNILVTSGTLKLSGANTYTGSTTVTTGILSLAGIDVVANPNPLGQSSAAASNLVLGSAVTLLYTGGAASSDRLFTINGSNGQGIFVQASGTGPLNLTATGAVAYGTPDQTNFLTLAGTNTGNNRFAAAIGDNGTAAVSLFKNAAGTWLLAGANTYTGGTTINAGTLVLGASNVLPNTSAVTIGNATLDVAAVSDTTGTLDVAKNATINLGAGGKLAFAESAAVDWTGGTLTITGNFVSGTSLRFGQTGSGLLPEQLALISATGFGPFGINASGFLTASGTSGYNAFAMVNAPTGTPGDDFDNDGVSNGAEYVLGGTKDTNDAGKLPKVSVMGGNLIFTFQRAQSSIDATTAVTIETGTNLVTWPVSYPVPATMTINDPGVTVTKDTSPGFDTVTLKVPQSPDAKKFARLVVKP